MATWNNTVPQGAIGTGNAQVFDNPVANQFGTQLQNLRRQQEIQAQQLAKAWRDNQLEASSGRLWANDIAGIEKTFIDRGIELQQKGINPYGSSKEAMEYQRDKRYVEAQQGFRKSIEAQLNDSLKKISANPDKYDPKSIQELNDFFVKTKLSDAFEKNIAPPQLSERFDVAEYLKGAKAIVKEDKRIDKGKGLSIEERIVDEPATQNMLIGALSRDPRGAKYVAELTSGFDVPTVRQFAPSYKENVKLVSDYIKGDPNERKRLATKGILLGTPVMEEYISDLAQTHTQARKKFDEGMKNLVSSSSYGLELGRKETPYRDPNEMTEYQRQSLDIQRQREGRLAAGDSGSNSEAEVAGTVPLYYGKGGKEVAVGENVVKIPIPKKNFVGASAIDLTTGQPTKITKSSNDYEVVSVGNYPILTRDITIQKKDKNGKIISTETLKKGALVQSDYAAKYPENVQKKPYIHVQEKVGSTVRDRLVDYNYMPKGLTKAQNEALGAFKPAAAQATKEAPKSISRSDIPARAKASGYTVSEYEKLLREKGIAIK